ncbi:hypothetical protein OIU34_17920 [Pararhizobium sp. BT-229]|uniref:hypothetical protein n=1 Tax=Pararhizobium sp. BT-229 TaxID=2986923 RepID=UPI0021F7EA59|nr:hypothetical protein [Pararhizobium sp. BT-229]MCV9963756.1 hypothetical protein [Pararhizobium sp. BT-229]
MQIDIKFPILVRANPAATKKTDRRFFGSYVHRAEVAEVSTGETGIGLDSLGFVSGDGERRVFPQLRSYDGRLYRPLGNPEGLFTNAFSTDRYDHGVDYVVSAPPMGSMTRRPLAFPIRDWAQWFIDVHGMDTARNYKLWPEQPRAPLPNVNRNDIDFAQAELRDVNGDDFAVFMRMFEAQANRLLVIGGKFWMETTMPCLSVTMSGGDHGPRVVTLDAGFLPLVSPRTSTWMRFPLSAYDEALAYAQQMTGEWRGQQDIGFAETDGMDLSAVGFDQDEEATHAMALAVGSNLVRRSVQHEFHQVHRESPPLFEGARLTRFLAVKDAILSNNDISGERSDLVGLLPEIMELWNSVKSPRYEGLGMPPAGISGRMIAQAMEMADNTTINVPAAAVPRL